MSGEVWSLKNSERYDQLALSSIERCVCYKKNEKMFLLLIFKDVSCIEYVRDEMAFMLDNDSASLKDFCSQPNLIHKNSLLVQILQKSKPYKITIYPIPAKGCQTNKERTLPVTGYVIESPAPDEISPDEAQEEHPKT